MRWLTLYLRSRRVPMAVAVAGGGTLLVWALWSVSSDQRAVDVPLVILTVLVLVAAMTATLSGPDDALERTAAVRWWPRRAAHLLAVLALILALLLVTVRTDARFGPVELVIRDAAGLLGLTALGAATAGAARAWFLPLGWTLPAVMFTAPGSAAGQVATWQAQAPGTGWATATASLLAVAGLIAYVWRGPARRSPAEAALS